MKMNFLEEYNLVLMCYEIKFRQSSKNRLNAESTRASWKEV